MGVKSRRREMQGNKGRLVEVAGELLKKGSESAFAKLWRTGKCGWIPTIDELGGLVVVREWRVWFREVRECRATAMARMALARVSWKPVEGAYHVRERGGVPMRPRRATQSPKRY